MKTYENPFVEIPRKIDFDGIRMLFREMLTYISAFPGLLQTTGQYGNPCLWDSMGNCVYCWTGGRVFLTSARTCMRSSKWRNKLWLHLRPCGAESLWISSTQDGYWKANAYQCAGYIRKPCSGWLLGCFCAYHFGICGHGKRLRKHKCYEYPVTIPASNIAISWQVEDEEIVPSGTKKPENPIMQRDKLCKFMRFVEKCRPEFFCLVRRFSQRPSVGTWLGWKVQPLLLVS